MTEIEKMKRYIDNTPQTSSCYDANFVEMLAIARTMTGIDALELAFNYGKAKGYRAAKAERRARA